MTYLYVLVECWDAGDEVLLAAFQSEQDARRYVMRLCEMRGQLETEFKIEEIAYNPKELP